jgi:hypothetical protein
MSRRVGWMTCEAPWWDSVEDNTTWKCGRLCVVYVKATTMICECLTEKEHDL